MNNFWSVISKTNILNWFKIYTKLPIIQLNNLTISAAVHPRYIHTEFEANPCCGFRVNM